MVRDGSGRFDAILTSLFGVDMANCKGDVEEEWVIGWGNRDEGKLTIDFDRN